MESLSVQVTSELKRALREQAERAGMTLSEWVRTRLELEASIDPDEVRAFLQELGKATEQMKRTFAEIDAIAVQDAERKAQQEREMPARLEAARQEGRALGEALLARGWFGHSATDESRET